MGIWDEGDVFRVGTNNMVVDPGVVFRPDSRTGGTVIPYFATESLNLVDSTAQSSANQLELVGGLVGESVFMGLLQTCIHVCLSHPFREDVLEVVVQLRIDVGADTGEMPKLSAVRASIGVERVVGQRERTP